VKVKTSLLCTKTESAGEALNEYLKLHAVGLIIRKLSCIRLWRQRVTWMLQCSDFQPGFRGTQGFREHMPRVPQLVS